MESSPLRNASPRRQQEMARGGTGMGFEGNNQA